MKYEVELVKRQNAQPGNKWHIPTPAGLPNAVQPLGCVELAQLQAVQASTADWANVQRRVQALWQPDQPSFFTIKGKEGNEATGEVPTRIHARDVCQQCSLGLLKHYYSTQKEGAHHVSE